MIGETNHIKVLVADDNQEFCSIMSDYFSNEPDFEVVDVCSMGSKCWMYWRRRMLTC